MIMLIKIFLFIFYLVYPTTRSSPSQVLVAAQCAKKVKDVITCLASEHRDLHGTVSKVGKAIDKVIFLVQFFMCFFFFLKMIQG